MTAAEIGLRRGRAARHRPSAGSCGRIQSTEDRCPIKPQEANNMATSGTRPQEDSGRCDPELLAYSCTSTLQRRGGPRAVAGREILMMEFPELHATLQAT